MDLKQLKIGKHISSSSKDKSKAIANSSSSKNNRVLQTFSWLANPLQTKITQLIHNSVINHKRKKINTDSNRNTIIQGLFLNQAGRDIAEDQITLKEEYFKARKEGRFNDLEQIRLLQSRTGVKVPALIPMGFDVDEELEEKGEVEEIGKFEDLEEKEVNVDKLKIKIPETPSPKKTKIWGHVFRYHGKKTIKSKKDEAQKIGFQGCWIQKDSVVAEFLWKQIHVLGFPEASCIPIPEGFGVEFIKGEKKPVPATHAIVIFKKEI